MCRSIAVQKGQFERKFILTILFRMYALCRHLMEGCHDGFANIWVRKTQGMAYLMHQSLRYFKKGNVPRISPNITSVCTWNISVPLWVFKVHFSVSSMWTSPPHLTKKVDIHHKFHLKIYFGKKASNFNTLERKHEQGCRQVRQRVLRPHARPCSVTTTSKTILSFVKIHPHFHLNTIYVSFFIIVLENFLSLKMTGLSLVIHEAIGKWAHNKCLKQVLPAAFIVSWL